MRLPDTAIADLQLAKAPSNELYSEILLMYLEDSNVYKRDLLDTAVLGNQLMHS